MRFTIVLLASSIAAAAPNCGDLAKLHLSNTSITSAVEVPAGSFQPPEGTAIRKVVPFCRVIGVLTPSSDSNIQFEVWLPLSGWNGKFQGIGNGGFAGTISFGGLADAVNNGYATASTDTGHHSLDGTNGDWAMGHPEKIKDFGYRAIHETTTTGKALTKAFYGEAPKRSYFDSCSNGGRQALMEAQRFPADYDGIIAGAPANFWTHLLSGGAYAEQALLQDPASYISAKKLPAIEAAALAACDALDGVKDGVIDDPRACHFDPGQLLCQGAETDACLTAPQIMALKKIYAGPHNSKGEAVFPGYAIGGQTGPGGWAPWITGFSPGKSAMFAFGAGFFRNFVYDDPKWDPRNFNVDRDVPEADQKMAEFLNATDPNLRKFKDRGGKLILYHGWDDPAIPAVNTVNYYNSVVAKMGAREVSQFVRLYMVPGMQHCGGGPGPDAFGQMSPAPGDASNDIDAAVKQWVENSRSPGPMVATHYKSDLKPDSGVLRTRPLCPYPQVAKWKGSGSTDDAANFECGAPASGQSR